MKLKNLNYKRLKVKYNKPEFELSYTFSIDSTKSDNYSYYIYFEPKEWLEESYDEDSETWENIIIKAYGYIEELLNDVSKAKQIHDKLSELGNESGFFELENYNGGSGWHYFDEYDIDFDHEGRCKTTLRPVEDYQMQVIENLVYMIVKMDLVLQVHSA